MAVKSSGTGHLHNQEKLLNKWPKMQILSEECKFFPFVLVIFSPFLFTFAQQSPWKAEKTNCYKKEEHLLCLSALKVGGRKHGAVFNSKLTLIKSNSGGAYIIRFY